MNSSRTPRCSLQAASARPQNSGPLSSTIASGHPRSLAIRSTTRRTQPGQRRIYFNRRTFSRAIVHDRQYANHSSCPHAITAEIDRPALIPPGRHRATHRTPQRIRCRILIANPPSRYSRYTLLRWAQSLPAPTSLSAIDTRTAYALQPAPSDALAILHPARFSRSSNALSPAARRRAAFQK